jgi:hypothetical protein
MESQSKNDGKDCDETDEEKLIIKKIQFKLSNDTNNNNDSDITLVKAETELKNENEIEVYMDKEETVETTNSSNHDVLKKNEKKSTKKKILKIIDSLLNRDLRSFFIGLITISFVLAFTILMLISHVIINFKYKCPLFAHIQFKLLNQTDLVVSEGLTRWTDTFACQFNVYLGKYSKIIKFIKSSII